MCKAKHLHERTPEYFCDLLGHATRRPDASKGSLGTVNCSSDEGGMRERGRGARREPI
jgi:hypothetical protein